MSTTQVLTALLTEKKTWSDNKEDSGVMMEVREGNRWNAEVDRVRVS